MKTPGLRRLAWILFAANLLLSIAAIPILIYSANRGFSPFVVLATVDLLVFSFVGAVIASRETRNPIGWILLAVGLGITFAIDGTNYGRVTQRPGALFLAWLTGPIWQPLIVLAIVFVPLLFPTGHLPSSRWRIVGWASVVFLVIAFPANALMPGPLGSSGSIKNPIGIAGAKGILEAAINISLIPGAVALIGALASLVARYRRAGSQERHQLKWFIFACVFMMVGFGSLGAVPPPVTGVLLALGLTSLPVSIAFAILKYHLYDIDLVINKSLVYAALAAFIAAVYVAIVVGLGTLVGTNGKPNLGLSIVATAIVAIAFQPVRDRVQRVANRLVYGKRATPYQVMADFSDRMAATISVDDLLPKMAEAAATGIGAIAARVILFRQGEANRAITWPADLVTSHFDRSLEVSYRGQPIGELAVVKAAGDPILPAEDKLLVGLASQAGLVMHNLVLALDLEARLAEIESQAAELRASRQRLVSAQDLERERLERAIHDGAETELVAISSTLGNVKQLLRGRPDEAVRVLEPLLERANGTLERLRDLARGVYPPLLRDRGLRAALEAQARKTRTLVSLDMAVSDRCAPEVETAIYFCCVEAMLAATRPIQIRITPANGELSFWLAGVSLAKGTLQQLEDRIGALGGRLHASAGELAGSLPVA